MIKYFFMNKKHNGLSIETIPKFNDTCAVLRPANLFCRKKRLVWYMADKFARDSIYIRIGFLFC